MAGLNSIYLLLGSNLGDRLQVMQSARDLIGKNVGRDQHMNHLFTKLHPGELLTNLLF